LFILSAVTNFQAKVQRSEPKVSEAKLLPEKLFHEDGGQQKHVSRA
jgi:hypothetical protein